MLPSTIDVTWPVQDCTDEFWVGMGAGEPLCTHMRAIEKTLAVRIERLAGWAAYSAGAATEQGKRFTVYVNDQIKRDGEATLGYVISGGDMSSARQIAALQACAEGLYSAVLANKPVDCSILIWRQTPKIERRLIKTGLNVQIYARLAWEVAQENVA